MLYEEIKTQMYLPRVKVVTLINFKAVQAYVVSF